MFLLAQGPGRVRKDGELTISYLDASLGAKVSTTAAARLRRRRLLEPYGFQCRCSRCCDDTEQDRPQRGAKRRRCHSLEQRRGALGSKVTKAIDAAALGVPSEGGAPGPLKEAA